MINIHLKPTWQDPIIKPLHELDSNALHDLLDEIPQWIKNPDYDRVDWLNKFLSYMWPYLDKDSNDANFQNFLLWYSQAGTPIVKVTSSFCPEANTYSLRFSQEVSPTPGQQVKVPMFIPLAVGLLDSNGKDIPLMSVYHEGLLESLTPNAHPVDIVVLQVKKNKIGGMTYNIKGCKVRTLVVDAIRRDQGKNGEENKQPRIVGMASILDSLLLVSFCGLCTFLTTLSLSAIASNGAIKNLLINGSNLCTAGITGLSSTTFKDNLSSEFQHTNNAGYDPRIN
ncbi:hypothetical protein IFM89_018352 [Coptis chinensis]|uniref:Peptidase M1 alanyl aminopeptidase Ig-like fold domain-containing protein n=1 Tax=Coptis chinensis TaxID=261450 RepID=A0A835HN13_9MAGN|nr:hypothetical protein IFM89_018352 [Coptis chinensis]